MPASYRIPVHSLRFGVYGSIRTLSEPIENGFETLMLIRVAGFAESELLDTALIILRPEANRLMPITAFHLAAVCLLSPGSQQPDARTHAVRYCVGSQMQW